MTTFLLLGLLLTSGGVAIWACLRVRSLRAALQSTSDENQRLCRLIEKDDLTEARSRRYLTDRLDNVALTAPNAILYIDLDDFKSVNDGYGHEAGDALLIEISKALVATCRANDFVARLGGDEFCVFLENCDLEEAGIIAGRFVEAVKNASIQIDGLTVRRSASIGVTDLAPTQALVDALLQADNALYRAKSAGRNRVASAADTPFPRKQKVTIEQVARGLENDEFGYYVQPIFNLLTGKAVGVEALIRWERPDGTVLEPGAFMDTITENYHISLKPPLKAANEVAGMFTDDASDFFCAFNISSSFLARTLDEDQHWMNELLHGLRPKSTVFEVVESAVIKNPTSARRLISGLQEAGVRIALDDFGVGHSNLGRLREYSVDIVKIDRSFVSEIAVSDRDLGILTGLIEMSQSMGFEIIAEGVETTAQLEALKAIGIKNVQGFLLGRPAPAADWAARLKL